MQIVNCTVSIGGDRNHTVPRANVTVAEVEVLRALHGSDAASGINPVWKNEGITASGELDRLRRIYRRNVPGPSDSGSKNIVDVVFPGRKPTLPFTLSDIGVEEPADTTNTKAGANTNTKSRAKTADAGGEL